MTDRAKAGSEMKKGKAAYGKELHRLQVELVKLQRHIIRHSHRILIIFEGRDASGKDGVIKRITQHLSPRETRVVALGIPTEREKGSWYFQRWVSHLPSAAEMVLFNRSWYNRAGVERVMGFCTDREYSEFINSVNDFEDLLMRSGLNLLKYYLDISRDEQQRRLKDRRTDPLKQWKASPVDEVSNKRWEEYSRARDEMFRRTHTRRSPWIVVRADDKKRARLNVIRDILSRVECPDRNEHLARPESRIIFEFTKSRLEKGWIAP